MADSATQSAGLRLFPASARSKIAGLRRGRYWAVGCLVVGVGIFSLQDLIIKLISADYPVHQA